AFYVETPREMLESGDFINPTFNYLPRFNKPVLSYWIVAAFYRLLGVSVTSQRVPMAIGAVIIIGCAYLLGRLAVAGRRARSEGRGAGSEGRGAKGEERSAIRDGESTRGLGRSAGLWAAVGLAAAPRLVMFARRIFIDIWITAFMSLTLACFALSERYPH